ncbi:glycine cleavage system aminomethyltransferase GcvT [Arenicella sp.]|nr:glycine cleavage system aminomethyltransferase GcvT [Arenicella sp.]
MTELLKTPLYNKHHQLNAKIVDFGGWALPVNYGSQIEEHHAVRNDCGIFDVSHMTVSDITGDDTLVYLTNLLANDISKIAGKKGKALYSCMLNETGGVIDDLIVYYIDDQHCRLVTNAGTKIKDLAWLNKQAESYRVTVVERPELALLAVQGPNAIRHCVDLLEKKLADVIASLNRFQGAFSDSSKTQFVGRTGYTGEDGIELIVSADVALQLWQTMLDAGIQACGLGARDTLRLEAGMSLYGNDLDERHTPLDSGLGWTVRLDDERDFIGKAACLKESEYTMIGLILLDKGVLRGHQKVHAQDAEIGEITSGTFSPTLGKSIALARVNRGTNLVAGEHVQVAVRSNMLNAQVTLYPFVKTGKTT